MNKIWIYTQQVRLT